LPLEDVFGLSYSDGKAEWLMGKAESLFPAVHAENYYFWRIHVQGFCSDRPDDWRTLLFFQRSGTGFSG
jgi:hypothetical protein